jgi:hypothetical protein
MTPQEAQEQDNNKAKGRPQSDIAGKKSKKKTEKILKCVKNWIKDYFRILAIFMTNLIACTALSNINL